MRFAIKFFLFFILALTIVCAGFFFWLSEKYVVPVIMYHNVAESDPPKANYVTAENFRWQMDYLKRQGYRVLSVSELVEIIQSGERLPRKSVAITFDDGYEDNYLNAYPILKERGFPAAIFMVSGQAGNQGYLSWDQMKEMLPNGITIGSHTIDHAYLPEVSADAQFFQITHSKQQLEEGLGVPVDYFAYPSGGFTEVAKEIVKKAGYKAAWTTNRGYDRLDKDVYELNRIRFGNKDRSDMIMRFKLSGYYNLFRSAKDPY